MNRPGEKDEFRRSDICALIASNPEFFEVYSLTGDYFYGKNQPDSAARYYRMALGKIISRQNEKQKIIKKLADCIVQMKTEKL